ncbi:putative lipid II flippase FtsW [Xylanibacillus composti]|uniref:Probable peptidoglycan glycosyltransferase FtsW n=1 Tax=Xylanibacillus composti TaxID=1572762 RepID=A0A8J4M1L1_9BACL|nr:putative lipid II flippase FtsW [Xylanibacillus composti]MDT9724155.1 putative lipid II flippase FtsW [Xylanibacillus composti]GIQ68704.1 stage V sporulation protein E [Xylanibacillus composti]
MNPSKRGTPDFILLALTILLVGFGILMVFSASSPRAAHLLDDPLYFTKRQIIWAILGTICMLFLMNIHYTRWKKWFVPFFFGCVILLLLVLTRDPVNGARSWLSIGNFGIQPSEFVKLATILYMAALIEKKGEAFRDLKKGLMPVVVIVGVVTGLIMLQPDFGTAMVFVMTTAIVIIAGGAHLKHIMVGASLAAVCSFILINLYLLITDGNDYRFQRIATYLDPWHDPLGSGYNIIHSMYAFGHGGLTGAGFGQSIEKLFYLPFPYTDFIFSIIGEELGLIGTLLFLLTYLALLWRGIIVALRCPDLFGSVVGVGIVSLLAIQALINIGGVSNAIPMTGVTLPFISYGGSSLLASMISMGILLSISREVNRIGK